MADIGFQTKRQEKLVLLMVRLRHFQSQKAATFVILGCLTCALLPTEGTIMPDQLVKWVRLLTILGPYIAGCASVTSGHHTV